MKIKIEIDESLQEDEVLIRCRGLTDEVTQIQKSVSDVVNAGQKYVFYKGTTEYYLQLDDVLFFQTEDDVIHVHTKDDMYETKYKLYQLEEMLPGFFMRISKSAILNTNHIYSISRNLTASSTVTFAGTHKQIFVSRYYYKPLISKLEEKRYINENEQKQRKNFMGIIISPRSGLSDRKQDLVLAGYQCI